MSYTWGTANVFNFNHLYDENLIWLCSSKNQNSTFKYIDLIKYDPDKKHCPGCDRKNFDLKVQIPIPKTYCANILHINRKIFI